jgi:L-ascorbate metabolism protein UlaG (beta-lactamase superfamily)
MRVTICGHAALYIETSDQRILLDPVFSDALIGGALTYNPGRTFNLKKMPTPTVLVVTHGHFDHFHLESLKKLPHDLPLITANDLSLVKQLNEAGFSNVITCSPWQLIQIGKTSLIATPSEHEEEEIGLLIQDEGCSFWHMADSEVSVEIGEQIVRQYSSIDLISTKYQPSVDAMIGHLRNMGAAFDKQEVVTWLEAACRCNPGLVFPYASGICFNGRHAWFNRYAFPLSVEEVVRLLQQRLFSSERATTVHPGDVIEWLSGEHPQKHPQTSSFVRSETSPEIKWEPVDTSTLSGLATPEEKLVLQQQLESFLSAPLALWLQRILGQGNSGWTIFQTEEIVWQLVVHAGAGERFNYFIDFRSLNFSASSGEHPEANFFTHISGQTLYEVLKGDVPGLAFWLTGSVRSYEKIIGVRGGQFYFPQLPASPKHHLCDPLTYYLRHFGTGTLSPHEPDIPHVTLEQPAHATEMGLDVEVLSRRGGNQQVLSKKALLTYLALKEAERIELEIKDEDIQTISDTFRRHFGLLNPQDTEQWMKDFGLTIDTYSAIMRNLTTVIKLEQQYANQLEPLLAEHHRIATAQSALLGAS